MQMTLVLITSIIGIISIAFCLLNIKLLYRYINKYKFDESKYTLLFGFLRLRYIAFIYILLSVGFAFASSAFIYFITL
jgi:Na+/melibiose symporter-like transporter